MSLFKTISYMLSNELDRTLLSLLDSSPDSFLDEKSYNKLVEVVKGQNARFTKPDAVNNLLKSAQKQTAWPGALRHLMVMHKLIHDFGDECYTWISSEKMQHLNQFKTPEPSLKLFVHKAMVSYYYNYLQKLSYSYNDLRICFYFDEQFPDKLAEENISPLHSVSKLQNTLRYLMQIFSLIEAAIVEFTPSNLVKQVAYFCFTDCYHYYTYINQVVASLFTQVLNFPAQEAIAVYEIYSEHLLITRKLKSYFPLIKSLPEFALKTPEFYHFDAEYNTRIELYVASLRPQRQKSLKAPPKTMPTLSNNAPNISISPCDESYFSLKDASLLITEVIASSNACIPQSTGSVFEPPIVKNKKKPTNIRIIHPGEKPIPMTLQTTSKGKNLDVRNSIDIQRTRGSVLTNQRVDASSQFDRSMGDDQMLAHINSTYPLAPGESFLNIKEDSNANTANNSMIHC